MSEELPEGVIEEAERLTRLARDCEGEEAATYRERRADLLAEHGYRARVRDDDEMLVLYPAEWRTEDTVDPSAIEDTSRAVEVSLAASGAFADVAEHNRSIARQVAAEHGGAHGENATAFAEYMSNHHARRVETARDQEVTEFLEEYFPRNAWPSDDQRNVIEQSLRLVFRTAGAEPPSAIRR
jgi:hypothetical protein